MPGRYVHFYMVVSVSLNFFQFTYLILILIGASQLQIAKFGPWGGDGGKTRDIRMTPCHLHSVTISSGTIIDSIGFSFTDHYGQHHTTGPWGGKEGTNKVSIKE
jgi:hypothetical protein